MENTYFDHNSYDLETVEAFNGTADNLFGKRKKKRQAGGGREKQHRSKKSMRTIHKIAAEKDIAPEDVSLQILNNNPEALPAFIKQSGQNPVSENQADLAAQAAMIHESNVAEKQDSGVPDYDVAEAAVYEDYEQAAESGDVDNFAPAIFGSIFTAGKKALEKINAKRVKNGKKPLFQGKKFKAMAEKVKGAIDVQTTATGLNVALNTIKRDNEVKTKQDQSDVQILIDAAMAEARKVETKAALKKAMPLILIGLVIVVIIARQA